MKIGVGVIGFGTVGSGVVRILLEKKDTISRMVGGEIELVKVADIDIKKDRGISLPSGLLTSDTESVVKSPDVSIVVELIGGTEAARGFVKEALRLRKSVVTANKALLASYGNEIFSLAREYETSVYFSASVGGGLPIVRLLQHVTAANEIKVIYGILNGTCNFILTSMEYEEIDFNSALKAAQNYGYAESDPSLDIEGWDSAHKAAILASLISGEFVSIDKVFIEGIRNIELCDLRYASQLGYKIKMLAIIKKIDKKVEVRVHPTLIPSTHVLARVDGVYNAVLVKGDNIGDMFLYGRGAGKEPTASNVVADIIDAAREKIYNVKRFLLCGGQEKVTIVSQDDISSNFYLRLQLKDAPGVLSRIAGILGNHKISIASAIQKEGGGNGFVPVVLTTHKVPYREMKTSIIEISKEDVVGSVPVCLRVETLTDR